MAPVKGRVLLDGRPLTAGTINTIPAVGRGAHADIQPDGSFQLHTFAQNDGALVGNHRIAVAAYDVKGPKGPETPYGKLLIPQRYTAPESSGLTIDVEPSGNDDVVLQLTSKDQKSK